MYEMGKERDIEIITFVSTRIMENLYISLQDGENELFPPFSDGFFNPYLLVSLVSLLWILSFCMIKYSQISELTGVINGLASLDHTLRIP